MVGPMPPQAPPCRAPRGGAVGTGWSPCCEELGGRVRTGPGGALGSGVGDRPTMGSAWSVPVDVETGGDLTPGRKAPRPGLEHEGTSKGHGAGKAGLALYPCGHPQGRGSPGTPRRQGTHTRLRAGWPWRQGPPASRGARGEAESGACQSSPRHGRQSPPRRGLVGGGGQGRERAVGTGQRAPAGLGDGLAGTFSLPLASCGA